ncbi:hypothetical protein L2X99_09000 [Microbacterium sp. KUDC0406]|uniref:hypothetical protein n=1 Tax=Microbacterium sp. KUDC0406 TaxID=2909588 RepID=UPI001F4015E5|nr:hypothetical protein [Microbacterium sp. KUDC0406]UJP11595.1 hypothetical protein L2X99_09000 [Microbacterium sp. KUDC0406]
MTSQKDQTGKAAPVTHVTTETGRILRVSDLPEGTVVKLSTPKPGAQTPAVDPARRADVLFRKRLDEGHEVSVWWMIGAFLFASGLVITLLWWVPGGA